MLKIAIVGCGKIADQHVEQILFLPDCKIVAVCDREELMAKQLQERTGAEYSFTDVDELLRVAKPDVVHITTPPQSHYALGKKCLEAGAHIYVEKPFTLNSQDAKDLVQLAAHKNLKLTVGHNAQFAHAALRMRKLVADGYLGGPPVHIESYYCYDLSDVSYAKALLGDTHHWVRSLPGGLLQNTISHGISKIAEFLQSEHPTVIVHGFTSPLLQSLGEKNLVDELRVIISDGRTTAYFTFSSQMRPGLHAVRLYGPKNGLIVDARQETVVKVRGPLFKSYLEQWIPPLLLSKQYLANFIYNVKKFLKADFQSGYGMRELIRQFYESVRSDGPLPIPADEIVRTAIIMDDIFSQLAARPGLSSADLMQAQSQVAAV